MPTVGLQDTGTRMDMVTRMVMVILTEAPVDMVIRTAVQEDTVTHVRHLVAANASRRQSRITLIWKVSMIDCKHF